MSYRTYAAFLLALLAIATTAQSQQPSNAAIEDCIRAGGSLSACSENPNAAIEACIRDGGSLSECMESPAAKSKPEVIVLPPDAVSAADNPDQFPEVAHLGEIEGFSDAGRMRVVPK